MDGLRGERRSIHQRLPTSLHCYGASTRQTRQHRRDPGGRAHPSAARRPRRCTVRTGSQDRRRECGVRSNEGHPPRWPDDHSGNGARLHSGPTAPRRRLGTPDHDPAPGSAVRPLTPDQLRLRAELATAQEQIVTLLQSAVGESLGPDQAQAVAEEARAWRGANAFPLVRYLSDRPDALRRPSSDCPTCVVRLPAVLTAVGHGDKVALVPCGDCGRTDPLPTNNGPAGRVCSRCAGRHAKTPCARCGKVAGIYARRPEGGICNPCRNKEPDAKEECADCHRMMISYRRLPDGASLCQTCAPKNAQTCCRCGRVRRVNALTSDGPVRGGCYSSPALPACAVSADKSFPSSPEPKAPGRTPATGATSDSKRPAPSVKGSAPDTTCTRSTRT